MKNSIIQLSAFCLFMVIAISGFAQDKIYKKNKDVILCTITELGDQEVKYKLDDNPNLIYVLSVERIYRVVLSSGKEITFEDSFDDAELYANQKKNAFKIGMFSHLTGAFTVGYERSIKPGQSVEASLAFIGLGRDNSGSRAKGATLKAGYKFISTPDFKMRGMRYSHLLKGGYVKPEFAFSAYQEDFYRYNQFGTNDVSRENVVSTAVLLNFGKQWIMGDVFLVDLYVGFGFGFDNMRSIQGDNYYYWGEPKYHYGYIVGSELPLSGTLGFKVGFLTKKPKG